LASRNFCVNLMHLILRILKIRILRLPPIQGLTKNGEYEFCFSKKHPKNRSDGTFNQQFRARNKTTQNFKNYSPKPKPKPPKIPTKNGKIRILFYEFYRRTDLATLLFDNLGSRNKIACSIFRNFTSLEFLPYKFLLRKVKT
jgi:hypothetical protein